MPSFEGFQHGEAVKFYSKTEHSTAPVMLLMSQVIHDKLSKAEQDTIRKAAKNSVTFERKKWDEQEGRSLAAVKAAGAQIVEVEKASFPERHGSGVRQVHDHAGPQTPSSSRPSQDTK